MSFFHEYFDDNGKKTLRTYSVPIDMSKFDKLNWMTSEDNLWKVATALDKEKHFKIMGIRQIFGLRKADKAEIDAGKIVEWRRKRSSS